MRFITPILLILTIVVLALRQNQEPSSEKINSTKLSKIPFPKNGFSCATLDSNGTLWFGSNGGGVFHFDGKAFTNYKEKDGLSNNHVHSMTLDTNKDLWFGTRTGLSKYNRKTFENISLPFLDTSGPWLDKMYPVINPNEVYSLAVDNENNLWIGTSGGGAYRYDGKEFTSFLSETGKKQEDSLYHNWVSFIQKDQLGNMWFASMTYGGIHRFNGNEFTQFLQKDGLSDNQVRTIYFDRSGKMWLGFNGNRKSGLTVLDADSFKTFSQADGLCNKRIRALFEDQQGRIWLGSGLGNLCIFDGHNFSEFMYNGQTFSDVLFILSDTKNNIWFGGSKGIWKYDGQTLIEITSSLVK